MSMWNTSDQYGVVSRMLHWGIALLFFVLFLLGLGMEEWAEDNEALEHQLLNLHTSLGILLAGLVVVRIIVSRLQTHPTYPAHMSPLERRLADTMKMVLNLLLILLPLSGYISLASKGEAPVFFGLEMPLLVGESHDLHEFAEEVHEVLAYSVLGLVLLHAAAAVKHHFIDGDDTMKKMLGRTA